MFKPADIAGVLPVPRVLPIIAVEKIGDPTQALLSRANQFLVGQEYLATVAAKTTDGKQLVEIEGQLLKMDLGSQVDKGQTLSLRFMQSQPVPTFYLLSADKSNSAATAAISQTGFLLGSIIKQANEEGTSMRYQANGVVTQQPQNPQQLGLDLKNALQRSGLFLESHLAEVVAGKRSIESMRVELQNVANQPPNATLNTLPAQQLAALEHQRLSWHGEIWQNQTMDWDVTFDEPREHAEQSGQDEAQQTRPVSSEITMHLPHLGKVSARIGVADGRVSIHMFAESPQTLATFKNARQQLFASMLNQGQTLEALTVGQYE